MTDSEYLEEVSRPQMIFRDLLLSLITGFVSLTLFGLDTWIHKGLGVLFFIAFVTFFKRLVETLFSKK